MNNIFGMIKYQIGTNARDNVKNISSALHENGFDNRKLQRWLKKQQNDGCDRV